MKLSHFILVIILSIVTTIATAYVIGARWHGGNSQSILRETAYERVMRTGTLRCAYVVYPSLFERDPNTGAFSGVYYEIINEIGRQLSLKIEWTEEVGTANAFEGFKTGRYDVLCAPLTPTPGRARAADFTVATAYSPFNAYVRAGDTRFDHAAEKFNDPAVKIAVLEGELSHIVASEDFPKATLIAMPNLTGITETLVQVTTGKADMAITEPTIAGGFMAKNPGKMKRAEIPPLRMQAMSIAVPVGDIALKDMLDITLGTLHDTGFIKRVYDKYAIGPGIYFYPNPPWHADVDERR